MWEELESVNINGGGGDGGHVDFYEKMYIVGTGGRGGGDGASLPLTKRVTPGGE